MTRQTSDRLIALVFLALTVAFLWQALANPAFQDWLFARHHNILSWYIRPLLLIPVMLAAWWRSWGALMAAIFALLTSMGWFPAPAVADDHVRQFLADEVAFLRSGWTWTKTGYTLTVLAFFALLVGAAWRHHWRGIAAILTAAACSKILFSLLGSGVAATAIILPALIGLAICLAVAWRIHKTR